MAVIPFDQIEKPETRHEWAEHIVQNRMKVHPDWRDGAIYLEKYHAWLRAGNDERQRSLFDA